MVADMFGNFQMPCKGTTNLVSAVYLLRMATTGSILAAMEAGIIPDAIPKTIQILRAKKMMFGAMIIGKGRKLLNAKVNNQTIPNPINPPITHKKALSKRNSVSIVRLLAPRAFLRPI
jgi:hypothetical protein